MAGKLPTALRNSDLPAFVWDVAQEIVCDANAAAARFWGRPPEATTFEPPEPTRRALIEISAAIRARTPPPSRADPMRRRMAARPEGPLVVLNARFWTEADAPDAVICAFRPALSGAPAWPERMRGLFVDAPEALELFDFDGAPVLRNAAARALFAGETGALQDRYAAPELGLAALRAALTDGAFEHDAELKTRRGVRRLRVALRRVADPVLAETAVLVGFSRARGVDATPALSLEIGDALAFGVMVLEPRELRVLRANPAARAMFGLDLDARAPTLIELAPRQAEALTAARIALDAAPAEVRRLDLRPERGLGPGAPAWLSATLARAPAAVAETGADAPIVASLVDLAPERRALAAMKIDGDLRAAARRTLDVGGLVIDAEGRILEADPGAAALLRTAPEALRGAAVTGFLDAPHARALRRFLELGAIVAERDFERGVAVALSVGGELISARLAVSPACPTASRRRGVAIARLTELDGATLEGPFAAEAGRSPADLLEEASRRAQLRHAVRDRLTGARGFAELLRAEAVARGVEAEASGATYLRDITEALDDVVALVDAAFAAPSASAEAGNALLDLSALLERLGLAPSEAPVVPALVRAEPAVLEELLARARGWLAEDGRAVEIGRVSSGEIILALEGAATQAFRDEAERLASLLAERAGARLEQERVDEVGGRIRLTLAFAPES